MDSPHYIVKVFAAAATEVDDETFIPLFHRFIQEKRLDEIAIDVANYAHVRNGPGIVLICHEAHYAMDRGEGRLGLLYDRKRGGPTGDAPVHLRYALQKALAACTHIEQDPTLGGKVRFDGGEIVIGVNDRLRAPNVPSTFEALRPHLSDVAQALYAGAPVEIEHVAPSTKAIFRARLRSADAPGVGVLLSRL